MIGTEKLDSSGSGLWAVMDVMTHIDFTMIYGCSQKVGNIYFIWDSALVAYMMRVVTNVGRVQSIILTAKLRPVTFNFTSTVPNAQFLRHTGRLHEIHLLVKESFDDNNIRDPLGIYTVHEIPLCNQAESTYRHSTRDGDPPCIHSPSLRHVWEYEWTPHGLQHPQRSHGYDLSRGGRLTVSHYPLLEQQYALRQ